MNVNSTGCTVSTQTNELRGASHLHRDLRALRAIHLVPRLRRVADMCSSKVSVNCVEVLMCEHIDATVEITRLPFPFIEAVAGL